MPAVSVAVFILKILACEKKECSIHSTEIPEHPTVIFNEA
jgi:hypothetical protein